MIHDDISERLYEYLGGICRALDCQPVKVGGYKNHVHILCLLSRKISQAKLMENLKRDSSKWIKTVDSKNLDFYWQDGYGMFSVNPTEIDKVVDYIENQHEHHKHKTFEDEFRTFLKKYNVDYDERYVWD